MTSPTASSDFSLLDLENKTPEEWRALLHNRIVQQKDIFVGDFKKNVINDINTCMQNVEPDVTLEGLKKDLTNKINGNKFEFEYQNFIDGIVGATFEYVCQFIIKNSMDNIKRTQNALNSISINNVGKPRCNESIQLQESSKLLQIQCLSESNNNTSDSGKVIQSHLFNNCSQSSGNSLVIIEKENFENTIVNNTENTFHGNFKQSPTSNDSSLLVGLTPSNGVNIENVYHHNTNSSNNIEDDEEDVTTNQAIMSLAMKISQQNINFNYSDEFDEQIINGDSSSSFFIDQNVESFKIEEEYKMTNSLKILESLVNIEHNKLETQNSLTENESQHPSLEPFETKQSKMSNKTNLKKKENKKSKTRKLKIENNEEKITIKNHESHCLEPPSKKRKTRQDKSSRSAVTLFSSTINNTSYVEIPLKSQKTNDNLSFNELKTCSDSVENITVDNNELNNTNTSNDSYDSNALTIQFSPVASTSSSCENNVYNSKNKSSSISGPAMKASDYKKIYEKDRKNLFSPDIIFSSKHTKNSINNLDKIKENNDLEKVSDCSLTNKSKIKISTLKIKNNSSNNKKKVSHHNNTKVTITNGKHKNVGKTKSVLNSESESSSSQKQSLSTNEKSLNKFKRLKMPDTSSSSSFSETESDSDDDRKPSCQTTNNFKSKRHRKKLEKLIDSLYMVAESSDECCGNSTGITGYHSLPRRLQRKYDSYNIKPVYVVINPDTIYR